MNHEEVFLVRVAARRERAVTLRAQGCSIRTIAGLLEVSRSVVFLDLRQMRSKVTVGTVVGRDGKRYPAQKV